MQVLELSILNSDTDTPPPLQLMEGRVRIGRDPAMNWVLPDEAKFISRFHCEVTEAGGVFILRDESSNGLCINSDATPLGRGQTTVLKDGDTILIGHYRIAVRIQPQTTSAMPVETLSFVSPIAMQSLQCVSNLGFSSEPSTMADPQGDTATDAGGAGAALDAAFSLLGGVPKVGPSTNLPPFLPEQIGLAPAQIEDDAARAMPGRIDLPDLAPSHSHQPAAVTTSIVSSSFSAPPVIAYEIPEDWDAQPIAGSASSGSARPDTVYFAELVRIVRLLEQIELILVGDGPRNISEIEKLFRGPIDTHVRHEIGMHLDLFIENLRNYLSEAVRRRSENGQGAIAKPLAPEMN